MTLERKIKDKIWQRVFDISPIPDACSCVYLCAIVTVMHEINNVTEEASGGFIDEWVQDKLKDYKLTKKGTSI